MLTIRLSRIGKKNKPMYRIIISEKSKDPYGRTLEILGSYNPYSKNLQVKQNRIKYWIGQGAQMSATINNLLVEKNIIKGNKIKASSNKQKKKTAKTEQQTKKKANNQENAQLKEIKKE
ncbi:MAG: 30S ribosomal protein S16 [Patescibacteria group bacterium]|nr:30S ribosomal protein S16 [Patescibacteria group bacterium]